MTKRRRPDAAAPPAGPRNPEPEVPPMSDDQTVQTFDVLEADEETGAESVVGKVEISADGRLTLLEADKAELDRLAAAVEACNSRDRFHVEVPPGPELPRFSVATRVVERGDDDFLDALRVFLRKYHGLVLA